jgi:pilus assembly protein CpaB
MRACAVRVNEVVGVAVFVSPGMRVDVLITGAPPGEASPAEPTVRTLLQNIQVLSAGTNFERDKEGKPQQVQVVTLLVSPQDAEVLSLAGNETKIQLVLRNPTDTAVTSPAGTHISELFGVRRVVAPPAGSLPRMTMATPITAPATAPEPDPAPAVKTIEVLNGAKRTLASFENSGAPQ